MSQFPSANKTQKRWLMTLSDLVTLLLTFFILMLGMAQVDLERFKKSIQSLREDRGSKPVAFDISDSLLTKSQENLSAQNSEMIDLIANMIKEFEQSEQDFTTVKSNAGPAELKQQFEKMLEQLKQVISENNLEGDVELEVSKNGIRLRVRGKLLFDSGQANLKPNATKFIDGIADALKKYGFFLLVEGHTDSRPITTSKYPSNWELSGARASNVVRYLINSGIEAKRLSAIGYADNYPIASNKTLKGRILNRRVEFIFTHYPTRVVI